MPALSHGSARQPLRPRRNPRWIAAGILAICLGAVGSFLLYSRVSSANSVLVMNATVMRGATLEADDVRQLTVGDLGGVKAIDSSRIGDVVGRVALVDLAEGSIVVEGEVGVSQQPAGHIQVGIKVPLGRVPNAPLPQGTPIQLISVTTAQTDESAQESVESTAPEASVKGTVASAPTETSDGSRTLDVWVPTANAAAVARLAALDQIAIVMEGT